MTPVRYRRRRATLHGGHAAFVAEAMTFDGTRAVLKVGVPGSLHSRRVGFQPFGDQLLARADQLTTG